MMEYNSKVLDWDDDEGTVSVSKELGGVTGAVAVWDSTEADVVIRDEEFAEVSILVLAAGSMMVISFPLGWPLMAKPANSIIGRRGGEKAGMEWGSPRCRPRVQLKPKVTRPSLVERLSEALPPWATMNWELDLEKFLFQDNLQLLTGC